MLAKIKSILLRIKYGFNTNDLKELGEYHRAMTCAMLRAYIDEKIMKISFDEIDKLEEIIYLLREQTIDELMSDDVEYEKRIAAGYRKLGKILPTLFI